MRDPDISPLYDFTNAKRGVYHERAKRTACICGGNAADALLRDGYPAGHLAGHGTTCPRALPR